MVFESQCAYTWGLIKRSLQGVMYSVTIRLGLNPSAKDRRWSSRKKLIFRERFRVEFLEACLCTCIFADPAPL